MILYVSFQKRKIRVVYLLTGMWTLDMGHMHGIAWEKMTQTY